MTYEDWIHELDLLCYCNYGLSIHDLPDMDTWSAWDGGSSPLEFFHEEIGTVDALVHLMA